MSLEDENLQFIRRLAMSEHRVLPRSTIFQLLRHNSRRLQRFKKLIRERLSQGLSENSAEMIIARTEFYISERNIRELQILLEIRKG